MGKGKMETILNPLLPEVVSEGLLQSVQFLQIWNFVKLGDNFAPL